MQINSVASVMAPQAAASASQAASTNSTNSNSLANPNLFIMLLTAQLKAQDPTNPMSPEQMVQQLTEINSLEQLISINQTLTNLAAGSIPPATTGTTSTSS